MAVRHVRFEAQESGTAAANGRFELGQDLGMRVEVLGVAREYLDGAAGVRSKGIPGGA